MTKDTSDQIPEHNGFNRIRETIDGNTGEVLNRERMDGNKNFVMLFRDKMPVIRDLIVSHPSAATLLLFLAEHMDGTNCIFMSQRTMAELVDISQATINRALVVLCERRIVERIVIGNLSGYAINAQLVWTTHSNGRRYARLKADMLISEAEQQKPRAKARKVKTLTVDHKVIDPRQQLIPGIEQD